MTFRVLSLILTLICSFERSKSDQSILDDFRCFDDVASSCGSPPVIIMMCGYSSQCATNMAAYIVMKEILGINVSFYPTTSYWDFWSGEYWDWNGDLWPYPRNYFEWLASDHMDLNFEVWPSQLNTPSFNGTAEYVTPGHIELRDNGAVVVESVFVPKYLYDEFPTITSITEIRSNPTLRQMLIDGSRDWIDVYSNSSSAGFDTPNSVIPTIWGGNPNFFGAHYFNDLVRNVPDSDGMNVAFTTVGGEWNLFLLVEDLYAQRKPFLAQMYSVDDNFGRFDPITGELMEFVALEFPVNPTESTNDPCYMNAECAVPSSTLHKTANPELSSKSPFAWSFFEAFEMSENQINLLVAYYWQSTIEFEDSTGRWLDATCNWLHDTESFATWKAWNTSSDWSLKETSSEAQLEVIFSPMADIDTITNNVHDIIEVFEWITKIESDKWSALNGIWSYYDDTIGIEYIHRSLTICLSESTTVSSKVQSFFEWMDYDKEQVITLFNTHEQMKQLSIFIIDIPDDYYYLPVDPEILQLGINMNIDSMVPAHGVLYSNSMQYATSIFCNNTWSWTETQVACNSMGFDFGIYLEGHEFDIPQQVHPFYGNVNCTGQEEDLFDCEMTLNASEVIAECSSFKSAVAIYCIRYFPTESEVPVRVFKTYDSYDDFLPLYDGNYTVCADDLGYDNDSYAMGDVWCEMFSLGSGVNLTKIDSPQEYRVSESLASRKSTGYDADTGTFHLNQTVASCSKYVSVQCEYDDGCNQNGMACAMDLDCCQSSLNHLFCHPQWAICVDIREIIKPDGYSPCYSQSQCASGICMDPGLSGICMSKVDVSCFSEYSRCFDDTQCCDGYLCDYGSCEQDLHNGESPVFYRLNNSVLQWPRDQEYRIYGHYLRTGMLFKLSADGTCHDDRSPVSNVPTNWHYADRGTLNGDFISFTLWGMYRGALPEEGLGHVELCYAVNDYASYQSTGLTILIDHVQLGGSFKGVGFIDQPIRAEINWIHGTNVIYENSTTGYVEYELILTKRLTDTGYIDINHNLMYPQNSWFYHQDKDISESMRFEFDEDNGITTRGYRDATNSDIPINVRLYWNNDGYPEIMERKFYVLHVSPNANYEGSDLTSIKLADIEFIWIDDDPQIASDSLRFEGESTADGTNHLTGRRSGDESLVFTCYGCGTADNLDLISIGYGSSSYSNRNFYSGNDIYITNTIDIDSNEITASYVSFQTSYVPYLDAPVFNLMFKISVASRFNYSLIKMIEPGFNYSYPADIDQTQPVIAKIEGEGCVNIGKRALNCPTNGKYNGTAARITIYGTKFPETEINTTVEVTIDGIECSNVLFSTTINDDGLRNVSCEFGSGVSAHGTEGYSYVQLSYFSDTDSKFSDPVRYFNYSHPHITQVVGCDHNISNLHTANCTRTGGGIHKLRIFGTNFGKSGARVFIGGRTAIETLHDADSPHALLWVAYGPGTRLQESIMVMNSRGGTTSTEAFMSYQECPVGYRQRLQPEMFANNEGYECQICAAGTYSNIENSDTCFECEAGKYQSRNGSSSCVSCPVGSSAQGTGNSECTLCAAGSKAEVRGSIECLECSEGLFNTELGSSRCETCNDNSFSVKSERDRCLCNQGYYMYAEETVNGSNSSRALCRQCTEGMVCLQSGLQWTEIVPEKNFMPMINTEPDSLAMIRCINTACVGGTELCAEGFTGVLCTECDDGLGKTSGYGCETCLHPVTNALRLFGVFVCCAAIIVYFIRYTMKNAQAEKSDLSTIGKIGFSFLQFNSMALLFDYEFPSAVDGLLRVQEQPATVANGVLSIDCFVKTANSAITLSSLYVKSICVLILPVFICVVAGIVFLPYTKTKATEHTCDRDYRRSSYRGNLQALSRMELHPDSKAKAFVNAWNYYITAVLITMFMIHPSIVQMAFALLNCKKLGALEDDNYLVEDITVKCWDDTHSKFVAFVAAPMCIFYVLGMPLFVLHRLYLNRDELQKDFDKINPNIVDRYHFLFKGYEPEFYYWEIVIMIRKILLISIAVFFSYDIQIQALLATLLVVIALCVHSYACPYVTDAMDGLELMSLFGSFCTFFFGQFLFIDSITVLGKTVISFIIVAVNCAVMTAGMLMMAGRGLNVVSVLGRKFPRILMIGRQMIQKYKDGNAAKEDEGELGDEGDEKKGLNADNDTKVLKEEKKKKRRSKKMLNIMMQSET